jgi:hypothetical protein
MAIDWIETLTAAGEIAKQAAIDMPKQLAAEDLTVLEASRLYSETERKAQAMDRLIEKMADEGVDDALLEAAEALQDIWDSLSIAAVNRLREMQGLPPVEFVEIDEGDE